MFSVFSSDDLGRLRDMFEHGDAFVSDVSRSNWTLVHSGFTLGRGQICEFLVFEGADLTIDATNASNIVERA